MEYFRHPVDILKVTKDSTGPEIEAEMEYWEEVLVHAFELKDNKMKVVVQEALDLLESWI